MISTPYLNFEIDSSIKRVHLTWDTENKYPMMTLNEKKILKIDRTDRIVDLMFQNDEEDLIYTMNKKLYTWNCIEKSSNYNLEEASFVSDINPICTKDIVVVYHDNKWIVRGIFEFETELIALKPLHMTFITTYGMIIFSTSTGIYKASLGDKNIASPIQIMTGVRVIAIKKNMLEDKICFVTADTVILYDTDSLEIIHTYNVKSLDCKIYNDIIWCITDKYEIWNSESDIETIKCRWHKPYKIKMISERRFVTIDNNNIVFWEYGVNSIFNLPYTISAHFHITHIFKIYEYYSDIFINRHLEILYLIQKNLLYAVNIDLNSHEFTWPRVLLDWINYPKKLKRIPITKNIEKTLIGTIDIWLGNIFEKSIFLPKIFQRSTDDNYKKSLKYLIDTSPVIKKGIQEFIQDFLCKLYFSRHLSEENCQIYSYFLRELDIDLDDNIEKLYNKNNIPDEKSDFFLYYYFSDFLNTKYFWNIDFEKACRKNLELTIVQKLLYKKQKYIKHWEIFLDTELILNFISDDYIYKTCEKGFCNEWIELFQSVHKENKSFTSYPTHLFGAFKIITKFILDPEKIKLFDYPITRDGKWKQINIKEINDDDWILYDDICYNFYELDDSIDIKNEKILTWVPHPDKSPANSLERALYILDRSRWKYESKWEPFNDQMICQGHRIKDPDGHIATLSEDGNNIILTYTDTIKPLTSECMIESFLWRYNIDIKCRRRAEKCIQKLFSENILSVPDQYKDTLIKSLVPTIITKEYKRTIYNMSCFRIRKRRDFWCGFTNGDIKFWVNPDTYFLQDFISLQGHKGKINDIIFINSRAASCSSDSTIRIWDINEHKCVRILKGHKNSVASAVFFNDFMLISIDNNENVLKWNYEIGIVMEKITTNPMIVRTIVNPNFKVNIQWEESGNVLCNFYLSPIIIQSNFMQMVPVKKYTCGIMNNNEYYFGFEDGHIEKFTVKNNKISAMFQQKILNCKITCMKLLKSFPFTLVLGTEKGQIALISFDDIVIKTPHTIYICSSPIEDIIIQTDKFFHVVNNHQEIITITYDEIRIKRLNKILFRLIKSKEWLKVIKNNSEHLLQPLFIETALWNLPIDNIFNTVERCVQEERIKKKWCKEKILEILMDYPDNKIARLILSRLFCFKGNKFKCSICQSCSTSPKRWPVCYLKGCGHRFHTKCINKLISQLPDWNRELQEQWALRTDLKCPLCREPFNRDMIMNDEFISEVCQYESDNSEDNI